MKPLEKLFFLFSLLFIFLLYSCHTNTSSGGDAFGTVETSEQLSEDYSNASVDTVFKVEFNKSIEVNKNRDTRKNVEFGCMDLFKIDNDNIFTVFEGDKKIDGTLYISSDRKVLVFVPNEFLKAGKKYKVVLSKRITSIDNVSLSDDFEFTATTKEENLFAYMQCDDFAQRGENIDLSLSTNMHYKDVIWHMNPNSETYYYGSKITYAYKESGIYAVKAEIFDCFGRQLTTEKNITVLHNAADVLESLNDANIQNIEELTVDKIIPPELKELFMLNSYSIKSKISYSYEPVDNKSSFLAFVMVPDEINEFKKEFITQLIESGKFLGIVNIAGFPAILSYWAVNGKYFLNILTDEYGLSLKNFQMGNFTINVNVRPVDANTIIYDATFEVDNTTIADLKKYIPKGLTEPLNLLSLDSDGNLILVAYSESDTSYKLLSRSFIHTVIHIIHHASHDAGKIIHTVIHHITNIISSDTIKALMETKNILKEFFELKPTAVFNEFGDINSNINSSLERFKKTIPVDVSGNLEKLAVDITDFTNNAESDAPLSALFREIQEQVNDKKTALNYVIAPFESFKNDYSSYIKNIIIEPSESKSVYLYKEKNKGYFKIIIGNSSKTLSFSTISQLADTAQCLSSLGKDFPIKSVKDVLDFILKYSPDKAMVGYFYAYPDKETRFIAKLNDYNNTKCSQDASTEACFGTYFSENGNLLSEIAIRPSEDIYVLSEFRPFRVDQKLYNAMNNENNDVLKFLDLMSLSCESLPDFKTTITFNVDGNTTRVVSDTTPDLKFLTGLELALSVNYDYFAGGSIDADTGLFIVIDMIKLAKSGKNAGLIAGKITHIITSAYNNALKILNPNQISKITSGDGKEINRIIFKDDAEFIRFAKALSENINSLLNSNGLSDITDSIEFRLEGGDKLGVGLGMGGTGTGGVSAGVNIGFGFELSADLAGFIKFVSALDKFGVNTFILTPFGNLQLLESKNPNLNLSGYNNLSKAFNIFKSTFTQLVDKTIESGEKNSQELIDSILEDFAGHFKFGVFLDTGVSSMAEEVAEGSISASLAAKIVGNGELLLNEIYGIVQYAPDSNKYKKYFYHPNIVPEIEISLPMGASVKTGIAELVDVSVRASLIANMFIGKLEIDDLIKLIEQAKINVPVIVDLTEKEAGKNTFVFSCFSKALTGETPDNSWYINGASIKNVTIGSVFKIEKNKSVVVESVDNNRLQIKFLDNGFYSVSCLATVEDNDNGMDTLNIDVK